MNKKNKKLIISATKLEISEILKRSEKINDNFYKSDLFDIFISGITIPVTIFNLTSFLTNCKEKYHLINVGIAGSFNENYKIGDLVEIESDIFADIGVDNRGVFQSVFETGLIKPNEFPFDEGFLKLDSFTKLPKVEAITVNVVTGSKAKKQVLINKYKPDVETMEGAAVVYIAKQFNLRVSQIRAISNMVEDRDKSSWNIGLAVNNINDFIRKYCC